MKRFLTIFLAAAAVLLLSASCDHAKPEFKFSLALTGEVQNAPTSIVGTFAVDVENDTISFDTVHLANTTVFAIEQDAEVEAWLNDYIEANVVKRLEDDPATIYDFYVKGFVRETLTGLTFSVDKRFTNRE